MLSLTRNSISRLLTPVSQGYVNKANFTAITATKVTGDPNNKVGPWPRTKEERERAAKKYNLIPEDYEPHDWDDAYGDYPKLKAVGSYNRDPYDDFDDVEDSRYHGEVYHKDQDLYTWERLDPLEKEKYKYQTKEWIRFLMFIGPPFVIAGIVWAFKEYKIEINRPVKHRHRFPDRIIYEFPDPASLTNKT